MAKKAPVSQTDELSYLPPTADILPPHIPNQHQLIRSPLPPLLFLLYFSPPVFLTATKIEAIANWKANVVGRASSIDPCSAYHKREAERRGKREKKEKMKKKGRICSAAVHAECPRHESKSPSGIH